MKTIDPIKDPINAITMNGIFTDAIIKAGYKYGLNVEDSIKHALIMCAASVYGNEGIDELTRLLKEVTDV